MSSQQLRQLFAMESQDTLQQMEDALLHLEKNPDDPAAIKTIFRAAHTIKGSAGVVGLDKLSAFTHVMENVLDRLRNNELKVSSGLIRLMLTCRDHLENVLEHSGEADEPTPEMEQHEQELRQQLQAYTHGQGPDSENLPAPPAPAAPVETAPPAPQGDDASRRLHQLRELFTQEAQSTLKQMLQLFAQLQHRPDSPDLVQVLVSATRNIVSSAAAVEYMATSEFARVLEDALSKAVEQQWVPDQEFISLAQASCEHLGTLIAQSPATLEQDPALQQRHQDLLGGLRAATDDAAFTTRAEEASLAETHAPPAESAAPAAGVPAPHGTPVTVEGEHTAVADSWHISLRFHEDALRNGIEPLASLRYLSGYGEVVSLYTLLDSMPATPENMDPERCYLGFEIEYKTNADKEMIESLFELVQDYCRVCILPPHSRLSHYIDMIQALPEDTMRLGEILLQIGTLTERELSEGLKLQQGVMSVVAQAQTDAPRIGKILVDSGMVQQGVVDAALDKQRRQTVGSDKARLQKTLNVDADKLDQLINLVGELVIANASINLLMQGVENDRLKEASSLMSRLVEEIRNSTLRMRMVHISGTFNRFRRLVHDLSHDLGKKIELVITGAEAELDKSMVEKINDPLMHLVRNAIDHGIETPERRMAQGKPAVGTLTLNAYHDSGSIVIEVSDDGNGLDRAAVLASAVRKGLVKPDQELNEDEIDSLIFEANLSTAESVTELSGRGVGLDVVKRNIHALNGTVDVQSVSGEGTTFQIFLPLTLAIIDGFLLSVGNSSFVVPLDRVVECVEFSEQEHQVTQTGYLNLRGKVLPLLRLHNLFGIERKDAELRRENIVVVRYGNQEVGLVVDDLLGEFQAVIKPLGKIFEKLSGVSGATILGSGEVALILDIPSLVQHYAVGGDKYHYRRQGSLPTPGLAVIH